MNNNDNQGGNSFLGTAIPIIGGIVDNVIEGMNVRAARKYNTPANQVARMREAGLPMAAASQIAPGGGFQARSTPIGTENFSSNLTQASQRQINRKQLDIMKNEIRAGGAAADVAVHNRNNLLAPSGQFEPTNQGTTARQEIEAQSLANDMARTVNYYLPSEKMLSLEQMGANIDKTSQEIKNAMAQEKILISVGSIKQILANYQERMSQGELTNLIRRNTGLKIENDIKKVEFNVAWQTQLAKITIAKNEALRSGEALRAAQLDNALKTMQNRSAKTWFEVKFRRDAAFMRRSENVFKDLIYLGMFSPNNSGYNSGAAAGFGTSQLLNFMAK